MSRPGWTLDPGSEETYLLPWLAGERDPRLREAALLLLASLIRAPLGRGEESEHGVYSIVLMHRVVVIWTLELERHIVILVHIKTHDWSGA